MKLQGDYVFDAPVIEVWKALLDPVVLAAVMPGCERLDLVNGQYVGELNIKVGPVQGKFSGKVDLLNMVEPSSYTMNIDGRGAPGFVKATAAVTLAKEGENSTRMTYDADAQVGGKIASVGQRLLEASSRAITKQSLEGLNDNIKIRMAAHAAAAPAAPVEAPPAAAPGTPADIVAAPAETAAEETVPMVPAVTAEGQMPIETAPATPAPAAVAAPVAPKTAAIVPATPAPIVYKKADQNALAAEVAREVTKSLPPAVWIAVGMVLGIAATWFFMRR
jgi:carbon monoxide dehydrogenase subunit G